MDQNPIPAEGYYPYSKSPFQILLIISVMIFACESIVMTALYLLPLSPAWFVVILDSIFLVTLVSPGLYLFLFRPLVQHISERKRTEEALRESEERFRTLAEVSPVGIFRTNAEGHCRYVNERWCEIAGLTPEEAFGEGWKQGLHPDDRDRVFEEWYQAAEQNLPFKSEYRFHNSKGLTTWVIGQAMEERGPSGGTKGYIGTITDINERKQAEEQIKASLKEKEVLLSEIHHRVKNNMQVIISLLKLQSDKIEDKKYVEMLQESQDRITSMVLVHEQLYQSKDFANIDFGEYIKSLANGLFTSHGVDTNKVKLNIDLKDISFNLENAIPCGLIINELVSNSLKHAFPQQAEGNISIVLRATDVDELELTVSDDGVGIPQDLDIRNMESMGLHLVRLLAEQQLDGKMEMDRKEGTQFHFLLKRAKYRSRI